MTLNNFTSGGNTTFSDELNENSAEYIKLAGLNTIRQLQDRIVDFSNGEIDGFAEAYVNKTGQLNTNTTNLASNDSALFDTTNAEFVTGVTNTEGGGSIQTTSSSGIGSWNNTSNIFDNDLSTKARIDSGSTDTLDGNKVATIGETFSSVYISKLYVKFQTEFDSYVQDIEVDLETFDGTSWNKEKSFYNSVSDGLFTTDEEFVTVDKNIEGVRMFFKGNFGSGNFEDFDASVYEFVYGGEDQGVITHDISNESLPNTISSSIGVPLIGNWEDGANIEYKLTNTGGDDTGWLTAYKPQLQTFTTFSSAPDTLKVRLSPKTSPTINTPSIKGFYVRAS